MSNNHGYARDTSGMATRKVGGIVMKIPHELSETVQYMISSLMEEELNRPRKQGVMYAVAIPENRGE